MNSSPVRRLAFFINPLLVFLFCVLPLLAPVPAGAGAAIRYVSPSDPTCAGHSPCHTSLQAAVDAAASGEIIQAAAGVYTSPQWRTGANGYTYKQVLFIDKSLVVQGGYHPADWSGPDPVAHPTVIDAQGAGRGVTVLGAGGIQVTLQGLTIQNGNYTGLGNPDGVSNQACGATGSDCGGGLFVYNAQIILLDSLIKDNIASTTRYSQGGGAFIWYPASGSRVENVQVVNNSLQAGSQGGFGAGMLLLFGSDFTIIHSTFTGNTSPGEGGGLTIHQLNGLVQVTDCQFTDNYAASGGGGLLAGLTLDGLGLKLERAAFLRNQSVWHGAAVELVKWGSGASRVETENLLLAENILTTTENHFGWLFILGGSGGGLDVELDHTTFAIHSNKTALEVYQAFNQPVNVQLTNSLFDQGLYGISAFEAFDTVAIQHDHSLINGLASYHMVYGGTPDISYTNAVTGDPRLAGDYHLGSGSAAIDAGTNAGAVKDIDGQPRPIGAGFDIGADEAPITLYLPVLIKR